MTPKAPFIDRPAVKKAALSSVKTFRRLSFEYKEWALEAEEAGKLEDYRRYREDSRRVRKLAWHNLNKARAFSV
jgi:hypothetical protein